MLPFRAPAEVCRSTQSVALRLIYTGPSARQKDTDIQVKIDRQNETFETFETIEPLNN